MRKTYEDEDKDEAGDEDARPQLAMGSRGTDVRDLQALLNDLGYEAGRADGLFGETTEAAVLRFQQDSGLVEDGIVGPDTWAELEQAADEL